MIQLKYYDSCYSYPNFDTGSKDESIKVFWYESKNNLFITDNSSFLQWVIDNNLQNTFKLWSETRLALYIEAYSDLNFTVATICYNIEAPQKPTGFYLNHLIWVLWQMGRELQHYQHHFAK